MSWHRVSEVWPRLAAASLLATACLASAGQASANCVGPQPGMLWSYPSNGAVDVPIDADLLVTGDLEGLPSLNGTPLTRITSGVYDLGELAPDTTYEVRWSTAVIAFTTGQVATLAPVPDPNGDVRLSRNPSDAGRCPLIEAQGCFDTGPPTRVRWEVDTFAVAWLVDVQDCTGSVRTMLWPGACGAPVIEQDDRIVCATVRGSNGATLSDATELFCSVPAGSLDAVPRSSSCGGVTWPPAGAVTSVGEDETGGSNDAEVVETGTLTTPPDTEGACALTATPRFGHSCAWAAGVAGLGLLGRRMRRRR